MMDYLYPVMITSLLQGIHHDVMSFCFIFVPERQTVIYSLWGEIYSAFSRNGCPLLSDDVFSDKDGAFVMITPNKFNGLKSSAQIIRHTSPDCSSYLARLSDIVPQVGSHIWGIVKR